jgi:hypothetical protein
VPIRTSPNLLLLGAAGSAAAIAGAIACRDWLRYPYPDMQTLDFQRGWLHRWSVSLVSIRVGYRDAPIYCVLVRNGGDWFPGRSIQRIGTNRTRGQADARPGSGVPHLPQPAVRQRQPPARRARLPGSHPGFAVHQLVAAAGPMHALRDGALRPGGRPQASGATPPRCLTSSARRPCVGGRFVRFRRPLS